MLEWIAFLGWIAAALTVAFAAYTRGKFEAQRDEIESGKRTVSDLVRDQDTRFDVWKELYQKQRHENDVRERKLLAQVQALSERLARLKVGDGSEVVVEDGEPVPFLPDAEGQPEPYSERLFMFLSKIESEEAKTATEDFIEAQRSLGKFDEQIADMLERGDF